VLISISVQARTQYNVGRDIPSHQAKGPVEWSTTGSSELSQLLRQP
jgi:hypothetical protein